ncbi:M4 family metallopeptidase [Providencia burhodogranariea]|uniref:Neutral metalloproteinase n=1 Tax=Providencia burhodogranariea DSM 19968 TaxID=1141662 RepID=K8WUH5_9GAMM|nr:M4 family metallopeptidase [Providencia burhodogranariea]EKT64289.1 peptidase M4, thermolysin [Providencia burhodogranariea DSM 19968]
MSKILGRSFLPPYLVDNFYQQSQSPRLQSTRLHIDELMSHSYSKDDANTLKNLFTQSAKPGSNYERIIRDAKQKDELYWHYHSEMPICSHSDVSLDTKPPKPYERHMPHEDYQVIMIEGDQSAPSKAAQLVYDAIGSIRTFYKDVLGIDKMFGCDSQLNAVIHFRKDYANAFWNSQAIFFGDGDRVNFGEFYNDIDIIAHELTHGFITFTSDFDYLFQSGALNESVADVIGMMIKQYVSNETSLQSNWLLAENIFLDKTAARALRSMSDPGSAYRFSDSNYDRQVGHMRDYVNLTSNQDNGGVHINSGIPNKAFYLLATELGGYSWDIAGKIWVATMYHSDIKYNTNFNEFAEVTVQVANDEFGSRISELTRKSWQDVGINV